LGFSFGTLYQYRWLGKAGKIPRGAKVLDFGSQDVWGDIKLADLRDFAAVYGRTIADDELKAHTRPGTKVEHLMRAAGFDYAAVDVYAGGSTRVFDLNSDSLAAEDRERYDVVTNCGTSEHIANQFNVFKVAHEALKPGGVMLNFVPFHGQVDHGLINYHPKFFTSLIANNGYEPLYFSLSDIFSGGDIDRYRSVNMAVNGKKWEGKHVGSAEMCVIWQKTRPGEFRPPSDVSAVTGEHVSINQLSAKIADFSAFQR
jgi:hypothetical protein